MAVRDENMTHAKGVTISVFINCPSTDARPNDVNYKPGSRCLTRQRETTGFARHGILQREHVLTESTELNLDSKLQLLMEIPPKAGTGYCT